MSDDNQKSKFNDITGLWLKKSAAGQDYMSVMFTADRHLENLEKLVAHLKSGGRANGMIFRVKPKKTEKSPDYSMSWTPIEEQNMVQQSNPAPQTGAVDDIPF